MPIRPDALARTLERGLPPVTWIHGDEPLIVIECADLVRRRARELAFEERIVIHADRYLKAEAIHAELNALSLFASQKLIDIRFAAKPSKEIAEAVAAGLDRGIGDDVRVLVTSERPTPAILRGAALTKIERAGVLVQIFPINHDQLPGWIRDRLSSQQQKADNPLIQIIVERVEGNLLAAHQEIRKLGLLFEPGLLPTDEAASAVLEVARYDGNDLVEAVLHGDGKRALRSIDGLIAEGTAHVLVIWHLAECTRKLIRLRDAIDRGENLGQAMKAIRAFGPQQRLFERSARHLDRFSLNLALTEMAQADTMAKGFEPGDTWSLIRRCALRLAGAKPLTPASKP